MYPGVVTYTAGTHRSLGKDINANSTAHKKPGNQNAMCLICSVFPSFFLERKQELFLKRKKMGCCSLTRLADYERKQEYANVINRCWQMEKIGKVAFVDVDFSEYQNAYYLRLRIRDRENGVHLDWIPFLATSIIWESEEWEESKDLKHDCREWLTLRNGTRLFDVVTYYAESHCFDCDCDLRSPPVPIPPIRFSRIHPCFVAALLEEFATFPTFEPVPLHGVIGFGTTYCTRERCMNDHKALQSLLSYCFHDGSGLSILATNSFRRSTVHHIRWMADRYDSKEKQLFLCAQENARLFEQRETEHNEYVKHTIWHLVSCTRLASDMIPLIVEYAFDGLILTSFAEGRKVAKARLGRRDRL